MENEGHTPTSPGATPPTPPQPSTPVAPTEAKKGNKWKWIVGGCLGCGCLIAIIVGVLLAFGGLKLFQAVNAPAKVVEEHLMAVTEHDYAKAYTYLSQDLQSELDLETFSGFIKERPQFYENIKEFKMENVNIKDDRADVEGTVIYETGEKAPVVASLVKKDTLWRIEEIEVKPKE